MFLVFVDVLAAMSAALLFGSLCANVVSEWPRKMAALGVGGRF